MSTLTIDLKLNGLTPGQHLEVTRLVESWETTDTEPRLSSGTYSSEEKLAKAREFLSRVTNSPAQSLLLGFFRDEGGPQGKFYLMAKLGIEQDKISSFAGILASLTRNFNATMGEVGMTLIDDLGKDMYGLNEDTRQTLNTYYSNVHYELQEKIKNQAPEVMEMVPEYDVSINKIHKRARIHKIGCPQRMHHGGYDSPATGTHQTFDHLKAAEARMSELRGYDTGKCNKCF